MGLVLTQKDLDTINMIRICGHALKRQICQVISEERFYQLRDYGIFARAKESAFDIEKGHYTTAFKIPDQARKILKNYGMTAWGGSNSPSHDVNGNVPQYLELTPTERERCRTEGQEKYAFNKWYQEDQFGRQNEYRMYKTGKLSVPDFSYIADSGELVFVETSNGYSQVKLDAKYKMAEVRGARMKMRELKYDFDDD
jgi:hypothetical protein